MSIHHLQWLSGLHNVAHAVALVMYVCLNMDWTFANVVSVKLEDEHRRPYLARICQYVNKPYNLMFR